MKIAFLHYHLKPGGVTTVIRQQILAIQNDCEILIITGEKPLTDWGVKTIVIPNIAYDQPEIDSPAPEISAEKISRAITDYWPSGCDVPHVHNPLLKTVAPGFIIPMNPIRQTATTVLLIHETIKSS